jgi:hypothetical protein
VPFRAIKGTLIKPEKVYLMQMPWFTVKTRAFLLSFILFSLLSAAFS